MMRDLLIAVVGILMVGIIWASWGAFGTAPFAPDGVVCTADAMMCPDGSFVGRVAPDCQFAACPSVTTKTYEGDGFTLEYPSDWTVDETYAYDQLGPNEPTIPGVKFHIPESLYQGTNLGAHDTGLSVEVMPNMPTCTAYPFLISPDSVIERTDGGRSYSVGSMFGAAAGNRYEELVYAVRGTSPCVAVRYFIHYGVLENYEPGTVEAFDRTALMNAFDAIRRSLIVTK